MIKEGIMAKLTRTEIKKGTILIDQFEVPKRNGIAYCKKYWNGKYGRRFQDAILKVKMKLAYAQMFK